jgi:hypothetical protein
LNVTKTTLDKILELTPVTYNWKSEKNSDPKHIGLIAQEVEQVFPDIVFTDYLTNNKSVSYTNLIPYTIKAIQELNLKVEDLSSLDTTKSTSLGSLISSFLSDAKNNLGLVFFGEVHTKKLCLDDLCITKTELQQILDKENVSTGASSSTTTPDSSSTTASTTATSAPTSTSSSTTTTSTPSSTTTTATSDSSSTTPATSTAPVDTTSTTTTNTTGASTTAPDPTPASTPTSDSGTQSSGN